MLQKTVAFKVSDFTGQQSIEDCSISTIKDIQAPDELTISHLAKGYAYSLAAITGTVVHWAVIDGTEGVKFNRSVYVDDERNTELYFYVVEINDEQAMIIMLENGTPHKQFRTLKDAGEYLKFRDGQAEHFDYPLGIEYQDGKLKGLLEYFCF